MKKLTNTENIKRYLQSGKPLRQHQAKAKWNAERLASIKHRLCQRGMWIIDIGIPGKHANYLAFEKGPIKNLEINGYTFEIKDAEYFDGFKDMYITIQSNKRSVYTFFVVTSEAFRKKSIMKEAWFASLPF